jgi:hypothetical protein
MSPKFEAFLYIRVKFVLYGRCEIRFKGTGK